MNFKKKLSVFLTAVLCMGCVSCGDNKENGSLSDKISSGEEESMEEMYQIALKLMDTDITARMNDDQEIAESIFPPDDELKEWYYDYYSLDYIDSYQVVQFLLLEADESMFKGPDAEEVWIGIDVEKAYQLCSYVSTYSDEYDETSYDYIENVILKIDGKWYYFNDFSLLRVEEKDVGFSYSHLHTTESCCSWESDEITYILNDGTEISEEEYEASFKTYYGYFVEKNEDGTFSLYEIAEDGSVVLDDGTAFKVERSRIISE